MSANTTTHPIPSRSEPVEAERPATDQPNNMTNQQESKDKQNADQPVLNLNYSTRDQLIDSLNRLSAVLEYNKPIPENAKERICKKIDDSIRLLVELSPFEPAKSADLSSVFEEIVSERLTVRLSSAKRLSAVGHLIAVRRAVQFYDSVDDETKRGLIADSKKIVLQLMELPHKRQSDWPDEDESDEQPKKKKMGR